MASALKEKIGSQLNEAQRSKDELKVETLRLLLAALHNREIEKRTKSGEAELKDEEVLEVIAKEAKKRKEAIEFYVKGDRPELAKKETSELKILEDYLPPQMSEGEVAKVVDEVLDFIKPQSEKDFGKTMAEAMKRLKGKADAGIVGKLLKDRLTK